LFDIDKLEPIKSAPSCFIPALFAHATGDDFIDPSHSKNISEKYAGDYNLISFDGNHISHRPPFFYDSVSIFFNNNLVINSDFGEDNVYVEEVITEEELTKLQNPIRSSFSDELARARQLSLQETFLDEDEENLQLALKLSLIDTTDPNTTETGTATTTSATTTTTSTTTTDPSKKKGNKKEKDPKKKKILKSSSSSSAL